MNRLLLSLALLLVCAVVVNAQLPGFGQFPVEITAEDSRVAGGLAIAERNVIIRYGETAIYCDYAQYNPDTRDVLLSGNVRIYREGRLFTAERALYNLETKILNTADFRGETAPFRFAGDSLSTLGGNAYLVKEGLFTTSDSSKPDYHLRARTVRIYPNDRVIFSNVTLFVGRTPIFWYPYLYQSLNRDQGFTFTPGYSSTFGLFLLNQYSFPISETVAGKVRVDLLSRRGLGLGFESRWGAETSSSATTLDTLTETTREREARESKRGVNWGRFRAYYISDKEPGINKTGLGREPIDPSRYRASLQDRTYITEDIYSTINMNKLSDRRFLQDFDESEFRQNANPDNLLAITKWDENYTLTLLARKQLNEDFDGTDRLPELALDSKRAPIFGSNFFYEGESSAGLLKRVFAEDSGFENYDSFRADTFHQVSYPKTFFDWLSVVPRAGVRGTYYTDSGFFQDLTREREVVEIVPGEDGNPDTVTRTTITESERRLRRGGSIFRPAVNAGVELSFKVSKAFEQVQSRAWGLDGLRHVVQPYTNASFVYTGQNPNEILQFDRLNRSTQLHPLDFPQFNTIDSLDNWSIVRLGVRNRLQTRRDDLTFNWLEIDTFFDVNIDRPDFGNSVLADTGTFSNLFNRVSWNPLPWVGLRIDSQIPAFDSGFTQINSGLNFLVNKDVSLSVGHRFINGNEQFTDSNLINLGGYFRLGENWAFSFTESYEFEDSTLEGQRYQVHRDLSSWVASLGLSIRDNRGANDINVLLTFTLKDLPSIRIPVATDTSGFGSGSGKNR